MLKTIVKFTYMNERGGTPERKRWLVAGPTETLVYKIYRLQGLNNYHTLQTLQGWSIAECYCKNDENLIKKNLTKNVK